MPIDDGIDGKSTRFEDFTDPEINQELYGPRERRRSCMNYINDGSRI